MQVVFVHIGSKLPRYLLKNLEYVSRNFTHMEIVLLVTENVKCGVKGVKIVEMTYPFEFSQLSNKLQHDPNFRNNFWFLTIGRFYLLRDYQFSIEQPILHVESDVLLAQDFPFAKIDEKCKNLAYPIVSKSKGIATTLYLRNTKASALLCEISTSEIYAKPNTTDMHILRKLYDTHPEEVSALPFGGIEFSSYRNEFESIELETLNLKNKMLGGIFDGQDIGMYFFGVDPRNHRGFQHIREIPREGFLKLDELKLKYSDTRKFLNIVDKSSKVETKVFSLHIHCKRVTYFTASKQKRAFKKAISNQDSGFKRKLILNIFLTQAHLAIIRRVKNRNYRAMSA